MFKIEFSDSYFGEENSENCLDFCAEFFEYKDDEGEEVETLATASGFVMRGCLEEAFWTADIDGDTFVEGYFQFLRYLIRENEDVDELHHFRFMVIKDFNAKTIGKGYGTALLDHLKSYAEFSFLDHITLIMDKNSKVDLDNYYSKVGFLKLNHGCWLHIIDEDPTHLKFTKTSRKLIFDND